MIRRLLRDDRGSTTVTGAFITALVLSLTMEAIHSGTELVEQRRTSVAADLAAVGRAVDAQRGEGDARRPPTSRRPTVRPWRGCVRVGQDVQVAVFRGERSAVARAGPAADDASGGTEGGGGEDEECCYSTAAMGRS